MAMSNTFKVTFEENQRGTTATNVVWPKLEKAMPGFSKNHLNGEETTGGPGRWVSMMCEEATLPGTQFATGQVNGIHQGSGQYNYPHTKIFNDLSLTWVCDANMTPLKFINTWMEAIHDDGYDPILQNASGVANPNANVQARERNRSIRFNFPDEYTLQCSILKAERGKTSQVSRPSIRYVLEGVFPYAVDSVPLSMGSSQLVKVSANFYYERWYEYNYDQWGKPNA